MYMKEKNREPQANTEKVNGGGGVRKLRLIHSEKTQSEPLDF